MAGKSNSGYSEIDKSSFFFAQKCGACHPGGGPLEYDRDGKLYYDDAAKKFGYELAGRDPKFDGDYTTFSAGNPEFGAPWDKSGVVEADCLMCHLKGYDFAARKAALNGRKFRWASTVGAGWASAVMGTDSTGAPTMKEVTVDYSRKGIADAANLGQSIVRQPPAKNCWSCHSVSDMKKRGRSIDPDKDVHVTKMGTCVACHPSDKEHNFAKGDANVESVRDDLDFTMGTCADCHMKNEKGPAPYPAKHNFPPRHYALISCEACHVPYQENAASLVVDNASTGATMEFPTSAYMKADQANPNRWLPALKLRRGKIEATKELVAIWWGDLNEKTGIVAPIPLWKIRDLPKPAIADDSGDGKAEVNTAAEIKAFLTAIKDAKDKFGAPLVAGVPALMKGGRVYRLADGDLTHYEDPQAESHGFSISHNVAPAGKALGTGGCAECHSEGSSFFFRKVLVDPYDEDGKPVYEPTWKLMGLTEARVQKLAKLDTSKFRK